MGKVSTKKDKTIYQLKREEVGLTREQASEKLYCSADTIERIENRGQIPTPEMVLNMSKVYREPAICNYFCSKQCQIGHKYVPEVSIKDLRQIVLEIMISMSKMQNKQQKFMEISISNTVNDNQIDDFLDIQEELEKISILADKMKEALVNGDVDEFAHLLSYHWELSNKIDDGTTNTLLDQILLTVDDMTEGKFVSGAGGGGFLQIILKKGVTKEQVHERLKEIFQDFDVDVWDCKIQF